MESKTDLADSSEVKWPLKTLDRDSLLSAYKKQNELYGWNISQEREFMENLFCQRFNFLLVLFSLFIAAAASAGNQSMLKAILALGALITVLTSLATWRAFEKMDIIFVMLYRLDDHPITIVDREHAARPFWRRAVRVNPLLGRWIPLICSLSLICGFFAADLEWIKAAG